VPTTDPPPDSSPVEAPAGPTAVPADLPRRVGFWGAAAVMVGVMVGSGIFKTPSSIAQSLDSPALILLLWTAGGLLALCGALTYAELATMFPRSGGVYVFLREAYGRCVAFVFGWSYMLLVKPLAAGGIAVIFAESLNQLLGTALDPRALTCAALAVLTAINVWGVRESTRLAMVLTGCKALALGAIVGLGVALFRGDGANLVPGPALTVGGVSLVNAVVLAMTAVLWTYDGWSDVGAIAGEVERPSRTLPLIYLIGTAAVMALYLAVNAVFMWYVPLAEMRADARGTVAPIVMTRLLGPAGGVAVTVLVIVSTLGSTHGSIMTGARVTFAQARDGLLFRFLGHVSPRFETPAVALWIQLALSCTAVLFLGTFEKLAGGFVFTMWIFYGLAGAAIFILRARRPDAPRPYRCPGYPVIPAVFVLASLVMTILSIAQDPAGTLPWLGVLAAGVPAYFIWDALSRRAQSKLTPPGPPPSAAS